MYEDNNTAIKLKIIAALAAVLLIIAFIWVWGHSRLVINVANPKGASAIRYTLTDASGKITTFTSSDKSVTKTVGNGEYQVAATQDETTYTTVVSTSGFLRKTVVGATLRSESSRSFVAANPAFCMQYIGGQLLSSDCYAPVENLKLHRAATRNTPQYVTNVPQNGALGTMEGMARTKFGVVVLSQIGADYIEEDLYGHFMHVINEDLSATTPVRVQGLDPAKTYSIKPYRDGFIAHDFELKDIFYIQNLNTPAVRISLGKQNNGELKPQLVNTYGDALAILYSPGGVEGAVDGIDESFQESDFSDNGAEHHHEEAEATDVEVAVVRGTTTNRYALYGAYSAAVPCGNQKLCMLNQDKLEVYSLDSNAAELSYTVPGVTSVEFSPKGLLLIGEKGVTLFNAETREGFVEYSFGLYTYCGISQTTTGYVLCIGNEFVGKAALLIDQDTLVNNRLDKLVLEFVHTPGIKDLSVYGNYVFVVPDYGRPVLNPTTARDMVNPVTKARVDKQIADAAQKLGLNNAPLEVVNTGIY